MQHIAEYRLPSHIASQSASIQQYMVAVVECIVKVRTKVISSVYQFLATIQRSFSLVGIVL